MIRSRWFIECFSKKENTAKKKQFSNWIHTKIYSEYFNNVCSINYAIKKTCQWREMNNFPKMKFTLRLTAFSRAILKLQIRVLSRVILFFVGNFLIAIKIYLKWKTFLLCCLWQKAPRWSFCLSVFHVLLRRH